MNPIQTAIRQASELLKNAYLSAAAAGDLPQAQLSEPQIEIPRDLRNGDYASSFAMQNAKALHLPPRRIAEALTAHARLEGTCFSALEIAGPGFLNLRLAHSWFESVLEGIVRECYISTTILRISRHSTLKSSTATRQV